MTVNVYERDGRPQYDIRGVYPDGKRYRLRRKSHLPTMTATREWAIARERELLESWNKKRHGIVDAPTLSKFWPTFVQGHMVANARKPGGRENYRLMWETHIEPELGHLRLDEITTESVQLFKAHLLQKRGWRRRTTLSKKSVNNVLTVLSQMLRRAVEWDVLVRAPSVKLLRRQRPVMKFHAADVYKDMCGAAAKVSKEAIAMVRLFGDCGLRLSEMIVLEHADVQATGIMLTRTESFGEIVDLKGDEARWVPLTPAAKEALDALPKRGARVLMRKRGEPFTKKAVYYVLRQVHAQMKTKTAGLALAHILRHTYASHMASAGVPLYLIQKLLGHKDPRTTMGYAHLAPNVFDEALEGLARHRGEEPTAFHDRTNPAGEQRRPTATIGERRRARLARAVSVRNRNS